MAGLSMNGMLPHSMSMAGIGVEGVLMRALYPLTNADTQPTMPQMLHQMLPRAMSTKGLVKELATQTILRTINSMIPPILAHVAGIKELPTPPLKPLVNVPIPGTMVHRDLEETQVMVARMVGFEKVPTRTVRLLTNNTIPILIGTRDLYKAEGHTTPLHNKFPKFSKPLHHRVHCHDTKDPTIITAT